MLNGNTTVDSRSNSIQSESMTEAKNEETLANNSNSTQGESSTEEENQEIKNDESFVKNTTKNVPVFTSMLRDELLADDVFSEESTCVDEPNEEEDMKPKRQSYVNYERIVSQNKQG